MSCPDAAPLVYLAGTQWRACHGTGGLETMKVSTVSEMRALDKRAIEECGMTAELLMENAGQAAYFVLLHKYGISGKKFLVICGTGNNGGDGFVIARKIHSTGGAVKVLILGTPGQFHGAAKTNLEILLRMSIDLKQLTSASALESDLSSCDLVVDAILGTGITRDITGRYRQVIELINASGKRVLSVDIPSGVHGDSGQIMGVAVEADDTVTFGLPKVGNLLYPGCELGGNLFVSHISFPPSLTNASVLQIETNDGEDLPSMSSMMDKGVPADLLFISGLATGNGLSHFAAESLLPPGSGRVKVAFPGPAAPPRASRRSGIEYIPLRATASTTISPTNKHALLTLSAQAAAVVISSTLARATETQQLVCDLIAEVDKPLLMNSATLTALDQASNVIGTRNADTIILSAWNELVDARSSLLAKFGHNKIDILQTAAQEWQAIMVLLNADSLLGFPDGRVFIAPIGVSRLARAGSGEVLVGVTAAMLGYQLPIQDAVRKAMFISGLAGLLAARAKGAEELTAQDIVDYLPLAVKWDKKNFSESLRESCNGLQVV
jgi:NAD(P)H-hydrate epimerase